MRVRVYVEGGGDYAPLKRRCREGFSKFFRNAGLGEAMPKVIACGGRQNAYGKFRSAVRNASAGDFVVLLVDSEGPVGGVPAWRHLHNRDGWTKPDEAGDDSAHLMVEVMESWFLADKGAQGLLRAWLSGDGTVDAHGHRGSRQGCCPGRTEKCDTFLQNQVPIRQGPALVRDSVAA